MTFHHLIEIAFRLNDILVNGISSRLKLHFVEMDSGKNFLLDAVSFKLHFGVAFRGIRSWSKKKVFLAKSYFV